MTERTSNVYMKKQSKSEKTKMETAWCETNMNVVELTFKWTISNFSFCNEKHGEAIESTIFSAPNCEALKWRLQLYPMGNSTQNQEYISLFLHLVKCDKSSVKSDFRFCVIDKDGREVNERRTTENWSFYQGRQSGFPRYAKKAILFNPIYGLLVNDQLRIVCSIKSATGNVVRFAKDDEKPVQQLKLYEQMAGDYGQLFENGRFSDVVLESCDGEAKFAAHRNVLAARSPVFSAMFEHEMRERKQKAVRLQNVEPATLKAMLCFIYTASFNSQQVKMLKLLQAADQFSLLSLKDICEQILINDMTVDEAANILLVAELHSAGRLKKKALQFIQRHMKEVLETRSFATLSETHPTLLVDILAQVATK